MTKLDQKHKVREPEGKKVEVKPKKAPKTKDKDKPMKEKKIHRGISVSLQMSDESKVVIDGEGKVKGKTHRLALFVKTADQKDGKGALSLRKFLRNPSLCLYMHPVFISKKEVHEVSPLQATGFVILK